VPNGHWQEGVTKTSRGGGKFASSSAQPLRSTLSGTTRAPPARKALRAPR
jgi:hypothetical protein